MNTYEIWLGCYHSGQGYSNSSQPEKVGEETGVSFKMACLKYELRSKLKFIEEYKFPEKLNNQDFEWFYHPVDNSNSWTGYYYETKEDALKSFNY